MKRRMVIGFVMILMSVYWNLGDALAMAEFDLQDCPEWLEGILMISTVGSDELADDNTPLIDQYICAFDFSNRTIKTLRVPLHACLMKYKGETSIFYRMNGRYHASDSADTGYMYRDYIAEQILKEANGYALGTDVDEIGGGFVFSVNPLAVFGVTGEGDVGFGETGYRVYYYLGYGVSDDGELEYQLASESTTGEQIVYRHYPLKRETSMSLWHFVASVSPSGGVAWRECDPAEIGQFVYAVKDGNTFRLKDKYEFCSTPCWIDDNRLLYTATDYDTKNHQWIVNDWAYVPRIWHLDTGEFEDLNTTWRENHVSFRFAPSSVSVDSSGRFMAAYISPTVDGGEPIGEIVIVSLADGKSYAFNPWTQKVGREDCLVYGYMRSDEGAFIYDPGYAIDAQVIWYN